MDMEDYPLPIVDPADRPRMRNVYRQAVEWGTSGNDVLFRGRRKDGEPRWFSASWLPIYDASHQCLGHRGSFRDVTQRVHTQQQRDRLEAQVRQAHRFESTGMLAATIAHDFNNILTTILGNAQLGMVDVEEGSSAAACFDEILTAGNRAVELCTQLQNVSGKGRLKVAPTPLEDLVWAACDQASDRLGGPIRPAVSIPADLPPCPCDPAQVQRMLCHLLINAAEAGSNGQADVEVFAGRPDPSAELPLTWRSEPIEQQELVYLEVRDDGCGMDAETLERAFDPFFTTKPGGRGLGLSIALGVVRAHRGGVWVDSAVDGGTTFRVYLPLSGPDRR
jgi:signal transduction histidine kinase